MHVFRTIEFVKDFFFRKGFSGIKMELTPGKVTKEENERP